MRLKIGRVNKEDIDVLLNGIRDFIVSNDLDIRNANMYFTLEKDKEIVELANDSGDTFFINAKTGYSDINKLLCKHVSFKTRGELNYIKEQNGIEEAKREDERILRNIERLEKEELKRNTKTIYVGKRGQEFSLFKTIYEYDTEQFNDLVNKKIDDGFEVILIAKTTKYNLLKNNVLDSYRKLSYTKGYNNFKWDDSILDLVRSYSSCIYKEE